jgi:hypothetical protein
MRIILILKLFKKSYEEIFYKYIFIVKSNIVKNFKFNISTYIYIYIYIYIC